MAQIEKGSIASINGNMAKILTPAGIVTVDIVIPWHLRGAAGNLSKGVDVVYVVFEDRTGLIIGRTDGDWNYTLVQSLSVSGSIDATGEVTGNGVKLSEHTHPYSWGDDAGSGSTGEPE